MGAAVRHDPPSILSKEDQRKAFRKARRHTLLVKVLRNALPVLCLVIAGLYFIPYKKTIQLPGNAEASIQALDLSSEGLKMINPRYTGQNDKLGSYTIEAEYALQNLKTPYRLKMHKITGLITHPDKKWTRLEAERPVILCIFSR